MISLTDALGACLQSAINAESAAETAARGMDRVVRIMNGPGLAMRADARANMFVMRVNDPRLRMFQAALAQDRMFRAAPAQRLATTTPAQARANLAAPAQERMNRIAPFQERMFRATPAELHLSWRDMIWVGGVLRPLGGI